MDADFIADLTAQFAPVAAAATGIIGAAVLASLGIKALWVGHRAASKGISKIGS